MLGLPGYLLNNLTSLSLNSYLAWIFATKRWSNGVKLLQIQHMFFIVTKVFGNIKNWFSTHNWLVFGWFFQYLASLLVVLLVCGWFVGDLSGFWLVCGWFGWFVGGLTGLCVVWLVWLFCGWFQVLQLTITVSVSAFKFCHRDRLTWNWNSNSKT